MRQRFVDLGGVNYIPHRRRFLRGKAAHVLRDAPQLGLRQEFLLEEVAEGRHRRAVQARAEPVIDVFDAATAVETPILMQVGGEHRMAGVVLQRRRGGPVAPALVAVAFAASD